MKRIAVCFGIAMFLAASSLNAAPAITFNPATGTTGTNQDQTVGWQFNVLSPLTVTGLGWYDDGGNGLATGHSVGIWNPSGTLLASILVPAGTVAALDGQFRTVSIPDLSLTIGDGYIIGGVNFLANTERLAANVAQVVDPRIGFVDATFSQDSGTSLVRPANFSVAETGFYGPMFSTVPSSSGVPDSGSGVILFGFALASLIAFRRRILR